MTTMRAAFLTGHGGNEVVSRGPFRPQIDQRLPLTGLHAALDRLSTASQFGKIGIDLAA